MDGVNLWGFYAIGFNVRRINSLSPQTRMADAHIILTEAESALHYLLYAEDMPALESCQGAGNTLWTQITENIKKAQDTPDALLGEGYLQLKEALNAFEIILRNQLSSVPVYQVSPGNWGSGFISFHFLILQGKQLRISLHQVIRMLVIQRITMPTRISRGDSDLRCYGMNRGDRLQSDRGHRLHIDWGVCPGKMSYQWNRNNDLLIWRKAVGLR
jgi:hypothetical protein